MITYNGETYLTVTDVARQFGISRPTCYNNILRQMQKYYLPGRKQALYKQSEVEQLSQVRTVEKQVQPLTLVKQDHVAVYIEDSLSREAL